MKEKPEYFCPDCKKMVEAHVNPKRWWRSTKPKRSFMGFKRIVCAICMNEFRYPLSLGYVVFYWLLLTANIIFLLYVWLQGGTLVPNPSGVVVLIFVIISLVKNSNLKSDIVAAVNKTANNTNMDQELSNSELVELQTHYADKQTDRLQSLLAEVSDLRPGAEKILRDELKRRAVEIK